MTTTISRIPTTKNALIVNLKRSLEQGRQPIEAASFAWKIKNLDRLRECELVLAQSRGVIIGVYDLLGYWPMDSYEDTQHYGLENDYTDRVALRLIPAEPHVEAAYIGRPTGVPTLQTFMFWDNETE